MGKKSKKGLNKKSHLPFRLNVVFFIVFILFAAIILQLGVVQILNGEEAQDEIDRTENTTTNIPVPRGEMYDRYGRVMVDNQPLYSITYTPPKGVQPEDRLELAQQLANYIDMDFENKLSERDLKEYFFLQNRDEITERIADKDTSDLDNGEIYQLQLDSIRKEEIDKYDDQTKEVIVIKKELDKAYALSPHTVKNANISEKEYSAVAEHLANLPGINVTADWEREYPFESTFRNYIGSITSTAQGVPRDDLDYYMSLDYSRNDRVGISGLEQQYEEVLRGTKEKVQYETDKNNNVVDSKIIREGERGKDLVLSIDMELQKKVDQIVQEELANAIAKAPGDNQYLENSVAVVSNPNTGEILAISGQTYNRNPEKGESRFSDTSHQAVYNAYMPGSTVKGATILTGLHEGAITPGFGLNDKAITIGNGPPKSSYTPNIGWVNDISALQQSSNVYMYFVAMRLGGVYDMQYHRKSLNLQQGTFDKFLYNFNQFGLGVETGLDFPYEGTGVQGNPNQGGNILDFAIGQFSTYTAMQLNQYVSTIANGGDRIQPRLVKEIHGPSTQTEGLGPIYKDYSPKVLNQIEMDPDYIDRVQEGFREVFQTSQGTASSVFSKQPYAQYRMAGKTGTAQSEKWLPKQNGDGYYPVETLNKTLIGYAPYDDPEVAFSVMTPYVGVGATQTYNVSNNIGARIGKAYFELKEKRAEEGVNMELNKDEKAGNEE
ncbi:penicillin-binding protein 2 [Halobacillus sp. BBL2006]|uniref:peptidoglycan D,D-transpeptidase FtsI family protein n=1 Tax=Halobacillus sp. BBL2006 TaxID=1543706 RepID=UPI0005433377|nr:penicillin-binding protein 2 [Halobacillus sp. BBL2006]KHE68395.1 penicillin-binding protein [Halobacillus sp. BBL2006]